MQQCPCPPFQEGYFILKFSGYFVNFLCFSDAVSNFSFTRLGGHQLVKIGVLGEHIFKGHNAAAHFDQTIAHLRCTDVIHLRLGDLQQLGQFLLIGSRLGKQQQKLAVGKHHPGCVGIETLLHILGDACHHRSVFTESLPCLVQKLAAVIGHIPFSQGIEEQVDLIDVHMSVLSFLPVGNNPVKDGIQHDQQAHRLETFAQLLDIIANDPVLRIHIGLMGKDIQAAFCKQFQSQRQPVCFRLRLRQVARILG